MGEKNGLAPDNAGSKTDRRETEDERADADRRRAADRRAAADRRRSGGMFGSRIRKDSTAFDRRRGDRREQNRSWLSFWRR